MSGLELINIRILEYAQQNLANIAEKNAPWTSTAAKAAIADLYQKSFLLTERHVEYAGYTYDDVLQKYFEEFQRNTAAQDIVSTLIFVAWMILITLGFLYIWFRYIKDLSRNIWRIQGMHSMIPLEIILSNKKMKSQFATNTVKKGIK
jgi:hypothetical protein